jgi:hypothetical protein
MRTFELSTRVQAISRGEGRSATAAAAYRSCSAIECEREGKQHDYRRKKGLEATEIIVPAKAAAKWGTDRAKLWNAAEMREKNGKRGKNAGQFKVDARTAREVFYTFPAELSQAGRLNVARIIARHVTDTHEIGAEFSIHQPGKDGDERNHHCHMLMTTRRLGPNGLGEKAREWDDHDTGPKLSKKLRAFIAATLNDQLRQEGKADIVVVEHRSFADRGSGQRPTIHQGPNRTNILRKQQKQERRAWEGEQKAAMTVRHGKELAAFKMRQDFALQGKIGELAERQRTGEASINRELAAWRQADQAQQKSGIRGVFRAITGRAGREAFEQQTREGQRIEAARQKMEALRTGIATERREFMAVQRADHAALINSHKQDGLHLQSAVVARQQIHRGEERAMRQPAAHVIDRQQEQKQERGQGIGPELSPL